MPGARIRELVRAWLTPRSYCSSCGRPFYTDRRAPCRCGETARTFRRSLTDHMTARDRV